MKKSVFLLAAALLAIDTSCAKSSEIAPEASAMETIPAPEEPYYQVLAIDTALTAEAILPAILSQFEGKVVLIDFWATWCGPCRQAMQTIRDIKPALAEEGCTFLYITGETSPEATWAEMIKDIAGYHVRLTNAQWSQLCNALSLRGIPSYMIVGADGAKTYDNIAYGGYPGNEIISAKVREALDSM